MRSKTPVQPLKVGDVVTIGRSNGYGVWQITGFEAAKWNPALNMAVIRRLANASFKPCTGYTRKIDEGNIKLIDLTHIKDHLQKKLQKQLTAIDNLSTELAKQGIQLP